MSRNFEAFYRTEARKLFGTMCLLTADRHEAEEIMQEAFVRALERWDRVQTHPDPAGYLFRTAFNLFRSRRRRATRPLKRLISQPPADAFVELEELDSVARTLRHLPPRQRAAIVLMDLMDMTAPEAAKRLGIRPSTVRALASQGRRALRSAMEASHG